MNKKMMRDMRVVELRETTVDVSSLLPEILRMIFGRLDVRDRGRAARVCLAWRDACYQPVLWRGVEAELRLDEPCPHLFLSLARRGIRRIRVLTLSSALRKMVREIPDLKSLDFGDCADAVTDRALHRAFDAEMPRLNELHLPWCDWIADQSLAVVSTYCPNLTTLDLSYCRLLTDTALLHIARGLKDLKRLDLHGCRVTDVGISYICGTSHHPGLTTHNRNLDFLGLHDCTSLTDESLRSVRAGLERLTSLDLSGCTLLTEVGLAQVAEITRLRELTYDCDAEDSWMGHLVRLDSKIVVLDLENCRNFSNEGLRYVAQLSDLRVLNLCICQGITDEGLLYLAEEESKIVELNLTGNFNITDTGLKDLSELADLKVLDVSHCRGVTDMGIRHLADGRPELTGLNVNGCISVGSRALRHIARGMPELRSLTMNERHVSADGLVLVARHLAKLDTLNVDGRSMIGEIVRRRSADKN